ncbi:hypothetical protein TROPICALSUN_25 [Erwinia phage vB_EamM_TropicalSun]|uniref:Uncharacterized protein n=1 Tax=Erwinia phage vB_EamM_TropicalSun TaxID=2591372 RepID=A0A5B9NLQ0_9CAUD|nr:hypothetical protein TROPICALSUN_25 [Erwinia phage vB_EamM_TropicalSun]
MINISGYGLQARLVASNTFPNGINITAFADDADSMDSPDFNLADTGNALNGELLVWAKPGPIEVGLNIVPTSDDDVNLDALAEANRVGKGKRGARDVISLVVTYPNGSVVTLNSGVMIVGSILPSVSQAGRFKTRSYRFRFENDSKRYQPAVVA